MNHVTKETAILAKEKGFNEDCTYFYVEEDDKLHTYGWEGEVSTNQAMLDRMKDCPVPNNEHWLHNATAPSQSILQAWLTKQGLIPLVCCDIERNFGHYYYHVYSKPTEDSKSSIITQADWKNFYTYEEALEACLLEALKMVNL